MNFLRRFPWRAGLAAGLSLGAAYTWMDGLRGRVEGPFLVPCAALVLAAFAAPVRSLWAQLFARSVWWANLVLGAFLAAMARGGRQTMVVGYVLLTAGALVLSDRKALAEGAARSTFRPANYLGTLQLMMVLCLADAQTMLLFAVASHGSHPEPHAWIAFVCTALALVAAFVGLARLAVWGVQAALATALATLVGVGVEAYGHEREVNILLSLLAVLQVVVPLPMVASMVLQRPLPSPSARVREVLSVAAVVAVVAAGLLPR